MRLFPPRGGLPLPLPPTPSFPILLNARFDPIFPWLERRRLRTTDGKPAVRKILRSIVPSFPIHTDSYRLLVNRTRSCRATKRKKKREGKKKEKESRSNYPDPRKRGKSRGLGKSVALRDSTLLLPAAR